VTVREDASNVAELMAKADMAISAAGSTCWELCFMGLPALLMDVADNQTELANELDRLGCAIRVGDRTALPENISNQLKRVVRSQALRQSLSNRSRVLVDGNGAARVVSVLLGTERVRLRRVRAEDARLLWEWANDSEVRSASFSSEPISWETHLAWFEKTMVAKNVLLFVAEDKDGMLVGQIRFELNGDEADLNLSVAKEKRGIGLAVPLIEAGISELFATVECKRVHALVKPQNVASLTAFERAGFARIGMKQVRGNTAVHFTYARN
jgi:RimJ/RimL family protein N-acetyltransferase